MTKPDGFHRVFVLETKRIHPEGGARTQDTEYKRSAFDICNEHARRADWAEFARRLASKLMRVGMVDEGEW